MPLRPCPGKAHNVSLDRERVAVRSERSERGVLGDPLRVVRDNGERFEYERHPLGPQRRGRGVDCFGHVEVEVRSVRVPRVADRAEHLAPADHVADSHPLRARLQVSV